MSSSSKISSYTPQAEKIDLVPNLLHPQKKLMGVNLLHWLALYLYQNSCQIVKGLLLSSKYQVKLHKLLQHRFELDPLHLHRFFLTPMGENLLTSFSHLLQIKEDSDRALLKGALVQTAANPQGLSLLNLLQKFSSGMQLNVELIISAFKRFEMLLEETEVIVEKISQLAESEAKAGLSIDFSQLPDIRCPGKYGFEQKTLTLTDKSRQRQFRVIIYQPQYWRHGKTPVVIMSHGLGSQPEDYAEYAQHLTSYGYLVAISQHPGSDAQQVIKMLTGYSEEVFKLHEFIDRPLDVSYILNELEKRNYTEYQGRLNLRHVGVMGNSFGGYTALALGGAEINFPRLETACTPVLGSPNLSLLLQCRALGLPRKSYNLRDRRVAAVLPVDPVGSEVFGTDGLGQIKIPVLIIAGSEDKAAPVALEQIRIFPWLRTAHQYLALIEGKAHFGNFSKLETGLKLMLLKTLPHITGPDSTLLYNYAYAISLAFFEVYVANNPDYRPYLQANYAQYLSQEPFHLYLIGAASVDKLKQYLAEFEGLPATR